MMDGMIMLWAGELEDIPEGWTLCDGTAGTPDLRNKFIVGAGDTYAPGDNGGGLTHQHTYAAPDHNHTIKPGTDIAAGTVFNKTTDQTTYDDSVDSQSSLPPYHALAFIMKL